MIVIIGNNQRQPQGSGAFTLAEVVISTALSALMMAGVIYGYVGTAKRAEWNGYSLAAQSLAQMGMEQVRAARWDPDAAVGLDEVQATNFPATTNILDIPIAGTNVVYATNYTTITLVRATPPLKCIQVSCVWNFMGYRNFTNTVITYRAPDN